MFNISVPFVSTRYSYDELLLKHIREDFNNTETEFLIEGVISIYKCLKIIDIPEMPTEEMVRQKAKKEADGNLITQINMDVDKEYWLKRKVDEYFHLKSIAIQELKSEISECKIRLGRLNIDVEISNEEIQFKRFGEIYSDIKLQSNLLIENPFPAIFTGLTAYKIFRSLHEIFETNESVLADYSFIYRAMYKDGFVKVKSEIFKNWLIDNFDFNINAKLKTIDNCSTIIKENVYKTIKGIYS